MTSDGLLLSRRLSTVIVVFSLIKQFNKKHQMDRLLAVEVQNSMGLCVILLVLKINFGFNAKAKKEEEEERKKSNSRLLK